MIEKSDRVGDSWHRHYERLHLHTVKQLSHLPGLEFPAEYPRYVPRRQLADYYAQYARNFSIEPLFGEEAKTVQRSDGRWRTTTGTGLEIFSDNVVIATGLNQVPFRPSYPGAERFTGRLIHSKEYRDPAPFAGDVVLVVGMGNTGAEIALDLRDAGACLCPRDRHFLGGREGDAGSLLAVAQRGVVEDDTRSLRAIMADRSEVGGIVSRGIRHR